MAVYQLLIARKTCIVIDNKIYLGMQQQLPQILEQFKKSVDLSQKPIRLYLEYIAYEKYESMNFECAEIILSL
jgi:hypothetical protein